MAMWRRRSVSAGIPPPSLVAAFATLLTARRLVAVRRAASTDSSSVPFFMRRTTMIGPARTPAVEAAIQGMCCLELDKHSSWIRQSRRRCCSQAPFGVLFCKADTSTRGHPVSWGARHGADPQCRSRHKGSKSGKDGNREAVRLLPLGPSP